LPPALQEALTLQVANQDANNVSVVIENSIVGTLQARDYKGVGNQYVAENKLVVEQE
jgi:hypothetical protein